VLLAREPVLRLVVPVADERYRGFIEGELATHGVADRASVVPGPSHDATIAADLVIVASGTASLETALLAVPMVIVYKVSAFTAIVARTFIRLGLIHKEMIGLPNLILGRMAIPELTQQHASGPGIADCAAGLLAAGPRRERMIADLMEARSRVAGGGALTRAARVILESANGGVR
jgi:lipid-A-disaccharide synthase